MNKKRVFFALWPDQDVRQRIASVSKCLPTSTGKLIRQENLHITLAFLGNVELQTLDKILQKVKYVTTTDFNLNIDSFGWWRKPGVIWLAPSVIPENLFNLVAAIHSLAKDYEIPLDNKPYQPHITLARKVKKQIKSLVFEPFLWECRDFYLIESVPTEAGVCYQVINRWPLKGKMHKVDLCSNSG